MMALRDSRDGGSGARMKTGEGAAGAGKSGNRTAETGQQPACAGGQQPDGSQVSGRQAHGPRGHGRIVAGAVIAVVSVLAIGMAVYFGTYYHAVGVDGYLESSDDVTVTDIGNGWLFDGEGTDTALVFYPGAKVEASAYAPLMSELAENGIDCFLVRMPLRFAIFDMDAALGIVEDYDYETWILSGHSLGGAMAANLAASNPGAFDGLVLLAAYPTESLAGDDIWVVSLYGSEDGILSMDKVVSGRELMPQDYEEICIEGGNHALFGSYGKQDGDGDAAIDGETQRQTVVDAVLEHIQAG